jgi:hypothetical protein
MAPRTCPQCGTIIYYGLFCSNVCSDEWDADQKAGSEKPDG